MKPRNMRRKFGEVQGRQFLVSYCGRTENSPIGFEDPDCLNTQWSWHNSQTVSSHPLTEVSEANSEISVYGLENMTTAIWMACLRNNSCGYGTQNSNFYGDVTLRTISSKIWSTPNCTEGPVFVVQNVNSVMGHLWVRTSSHLCKEGV